MASSSTGATARPHLDLTGRTGCSQAPFLNLVPMVTCCSPAVETHDGKYSHVDLGNLVRLASMITPVSRGSFAEQANEVLASLEDLLSRQSVRMALTVQTVFLKDPADRQAYEELLQRRWGSERPVLSYVLQPPCAGAALAVESWAIGGNDVKILRHAPGVLSVEYDGVRWICCGDNYGMLMPGHESVYDQANAVIGRTADMLRLAGSGLEHMVRTWFYLGDITGDEGDKQRYKELNRARTDAYRGVQFYCSLLHPSIPHGVYPASTGIGMDGRGLTMSCLALDTARKDIYLLPLENPQQTPAYAYHSRYSPQSPKFSRAMAMVMDGYVTTWISGTASILDSESCHMDDAGRQTEQTLENIEKLISRDNFVFHGVPGAAATLRDLAKVRVYVKREEDYAQVRDVCQRRLGNVPVIYVVADVCRPELLVEIEAVAFARRDRR